MSQQRAWGSYKARRVLAALIRIGWTEKRHKSGSHRTLSRPGFPDYTFSFHDNDTIGSAMMGRIAKHTGLKPGDL
jgi:predicted RNA binding protein YcfA (HicA-like mRNA interferase family)